MSERIFISPMIIEENILGEEPEPSRPKQVYVFKGKEEVYPGLAYSRAFVYARTGGLERFYLKQVSGVYHLFHNERSLASVYGLIYNIAGTIQRIGIAIQLPDYTHSFIVLEGANPIYELTEYKIGFISKKICIPRRIDVGLSGDRLVAYIRSVTPNNERCEDIVVYEKSPGKFATKKVGNGIPLGWNGKWFTYLEIRKDNIVVNAFIMGEWKKHVLPKSVISERYRVPGAMTYYDGEHAVLNNGYELIGVDLESATSMWRKTVGENVQTPLIAVENKEIVVFKAKELYVINVETGAPLWKQEFDKQITAAGLGYRYLGVATNDILYIYERIMNRFRLIGRYKIPGLINGVSIYEKSEDEQTALIGYISPDEVPHVIQVNFAESIGFRIKDFEIASGGTAEYEIMEVTPTVELIRKPRARLRVISESNKIIIIDRGSPPGTYTATVLVKIPGFLPIIEDIKIVVKKLESAFREIRIQPKIVPGVLGPFVPVTIDPLVELDDLYIVATSDNGNLFGTTTIYHDLNVGRKVLPLYILWAKTGIYQAKISIIARSRRRPIYEEIRAKILADFDIPPFHLRVSGTTAYIWSPFNIDAAKIIFESREAEYTIIQDLRKGWNEIDTHGMIPDRVRIRLKSGIEYIVWRGLSWIQLRRSE